MPRVLPARRSGSRPGHGADGVVHGGGPTGAVGRCGAGLPVIVGRRRVAASRHQSGSIGTEKPWSRPRSTARVTAAVPKRSRTSSRAVSSAPPLCESKGRTSWHGALVVEVRDRQPDEGEALLLHQRSDRGQEHPGHPEDGLGVRRRPRQGVRARHPGEVVEADAEHDGASGPAGGSHAAGDAIDHADEDRVDLRERPRRATESPLRTDRTAATTDLHRAGVAVVGQRVELVARGPAEHRHQRRLGDLRHLAHGRDAPVPAAWRR